MQAMREKLEKKMADLTPQISHLDQNYASPSPDAYKQRLVLQAEFNNLSSMHAEYLLFKCRYAQYKQGDMSRKLLAHQLRQKS